MRPFFQYMTARIKEAHKEQTFRTYISDTLYYHERQMALTVRYGELLNNGPKADNRSGDEIAKDVITRLGLKVV